MTFDIATLAKRLEKFKELRRPHEATWKACFDHTFTERGSGLEAATPMTATDIMLAKAGMLHSVTVDAARILAAAIVSGATPSSSVWGLLGSAGADDAGKKFLDESAKFLHEEIHAATFDAAAFECSMDMVAAGWFALYIDVDRDRGGFVFEQWPLSQVFASTTKAGGLIDTIYREYTLTAEQAVHEFGESGVSEKTRKAMALNPDEQVRVCHAIFPRWPHAEGAVLARNMPVASIKFEVDNKHPLSESGYHEMPVIVPRWSVIPGSVYAIGPAMTALADSKQLNRLTALDNSNAELAISGMWIAQDDGVLNPRTVTVGGGKVIVANSVDSMKQLAAGGDWQLAETRIGQLEGRIRRALMADQLQPQDGPAMTATEVHVRVGMIRQLLGPIYGRLQAEYLAPMLERCFGLAYRAGVLGPAPVSLRGYRAKYNNPLARAQKLEDVGAIERLNSSAQVMAEIKPDVLDNIDFDEEFRTLADSLGTPKRILRDVDAVKALRDERAQQQAQAQQQQVDQQLGLQAAEAATQRAVKAA